MGLHAYLEQFRGDESAADEQAVRSILDMLKDENADWDFPTLRWYVEDAARKAGMDKDTDISALTRRIVSMWYAEVAEEGLV